MSRIGIASDHGGFQLKGAVVRALRNWAIDFEDLGPYSPDACDYPDYAHELAHGFETNRFSLGILICGTGIGMSIAANRHSALRAAVVSDCFSARMAREHNHANVLCLGARVVGEGLALAIVRAWLDATPDTDPRHLRRLAKLDPPRS